MKQKLSDSLNTIKDSTKRVFALAKSSPAIVIAILAGAFVVLAAVVLVTVMRSGNTQPMPPVATPDAPPTTVAKPLSSQELINQVKLVFYNYNISRDKVIESFRPADVNSDAKPVFMIQVETAQADSLRGDVLEVFRINRLTALPLDDVNYLAVETDDFRFELYIKASAIVENPPLPPIVRPEVVLPPAGNGKIALLIDDAGTNLQLAAELTALKVPMAVAILPHMPYSRETADIVRQNGKDVFLHYPMEPLSYPNTDPGPGAALLHMPELLIMETSKQNIESLGGTVDGVNNHMGSAFTADEEKMKQMLESLRQYTDHFVDSNTNTQSVAYKVCKEDGGFRCGMNRKFLDNESDHDYIRLRLYESVTMANKGGAMIIIGHLRPDTVTVLMEEIPKLQKLGYEFVEIDSVME